MIVGRLRSARIEDRVGCGGSLVRSLNVASVTGQVLLLDFGCRLHARELEASRLELI